MTGTNLPQNRRIPMAKIEQTFLVFSLDKDHVYRMHDDDWGYA